VEKTKYEYGRHVERFCVFVRSSFFQVKVKVKVKLTLEQTVQASALDGVGGQPHAPAALPPAKRPIAQCKGSWVGSSAGLDGYGEPRPHRDSIPDRRTCSESLYRLSCAGPPFLGRGIF
jgi:hypothetical protein